MFTQVVSGPRHHILTLFTDQHTIKAHYSHSVKCKVIHVYEMCKMAKYFFYFLDLFEYVFLKQLHSWHKLLDSAKLQYV